MNKYVCPVCGGKLFYWKEKVVESRKFVNPKTGILQKTVTNINYTDSTGDGNEGVECNKCGWCYNTISLQSVSPTGQADVSEAILKAITHIDGE